MCTFDGIIKK